MKYIFSALLLLIVILPGQGGTFSSAAYTLDHKNWFKTAYPTFDAMFLAPKNSTGTYHENISILKRNHPHKDAVDWETIKTYQIEALKKAVGDFKLLSWENFKLDNTESRKIHYTGKYGNYNLEWVQFYVLKQNTWYVISYVGEGKDFADYLKEAMDIINSFKFK